MDNYDNLEHIAPKPKHLHAEDVNKYIPQQEAAFVELKPKETAQYDLVEYKFTQEEIDNIEYFVALKSQILWTIAGLIEPMFFGSLWFIRHVIHGDRYNPKRKHTKKKNKNAQKTIVLPNLPK